LKLVICTNHSHPNLGGCEKVLEQLAEDFVSQYHCEVFVISGSVNKSFRYHGVNYVPLIRRSAGALAQQINSYQPDTLFVYSDNFESFMDFPKINDAIFCKRKILSPVGFNRFIGREIFFGGFKKKCSDWIIAPHSNNYVDYQFAIDNGFETRVIPYGMKLSEFVDAKPGIFLSSRNIDKNKPMLLYVANFFPDKGQDNIIRCYDALYNNRVEFTAVFIASTTRFPAINARTDVISALLRKKAYDVRILKDISRQDTLNAFADASIFTFASTKEVGPLVLLEAMATQTPWVSLPVGIVPTLEGGSIIPANKNPKGYYIFDKMVLSNYVKVISDLLSDKNKCQKMGKEGYDHFNKFHVWEKILPIYHKALME